MTWADEEWERLMEKKRNGEDWTVEDWEAWSYIENVQAESRWLDSQD